MTVIDKKEREPIDKLDRMMDQYERAIVLVREELRRARRKFGPMRGPHEGYAVLLEEVDELWDEVKSNNRFLACKEAIRVAAMAISFIVDCSNDGDLDWLERKSFPHPMHEGDVA